MTAARAPNPWLEEAYKFGKLNDSFVPLSPRENPMSWTAWRDYFRWLNWAPSWFIEVERLHALDRSSDKTWTAPVDHPDKFAPRFTQAKGPPPVFPLTQSKPQYGPRQGHIEGLRAQGRLSFGSKDIDGAKRNWFARLTMDEAKRNLGMTE